MNPDRAGNNLRHAKPLQLGPKAKALKDWVGRTDRFDYFRFHLNHRSHLTLALKQLQANANMQLLNRQGRILQTSAQPGKAAESLDLDLEGGTYYVRVYAAQKANTTYRFTFSKTAPSPSLPSFTRFDLWDASGDSTPDTTFVGGAMRLGYTLSHSTALSQVRLEAVKNGDVVNLGSWTGASLPYGLVNLANVPALTSGSYEFRLVAQTTGGQAVVSESRSLKVLSWQTLNGSAIADTVNYSTTSSAVALGRGGTDTLNLDVSMSMITAINGLAPAAFNPVQNSLGSQAIFRGTAFDYITFADGRELYFQGIEALHFSDNTSVELQVRANDAEYYQQWNLRASDVESAWRFSRGSRGVLIVSLDSGVPLSDTPEGRLVDLTSNRLVTDPSDDDLSIGYGHGHCSISIMSAIANNQQGIAGINWNSDVYVGRVFGGASLQQVIQDAIAYARSNHQRVVFQGGIQGESWLTNGGTQAALEQLIAANADIATFVMAAGNGNVDIGDPTADFWMGGGVARLAETHGNVMAVGALTTRGITQVNGLNNAIAVDRAGYSNYGNPLTLMAATDSPAMNKLGDVEIFGGTSCANPNLAGIASLVWSVNTRLSGADIRQILTDTAMDLGSVGQDLLFGHGLVNADAAVRRAWALAKNTDLAQLHSGSSLLV